MATDLPTTNTPYPQSTRLVLMVSVAVGLSIMGDSLMYGILPLEAESLGFTLSGVGLLLSANRLIRLVSNAWASTFFERFGPRLPFLLATAIGFGAALVYGAGWGFTLFLLARIGWGIAWSGLRQGGYAAVWTGDDRRKGRLMGLLFGIIRLGSATSVIVGGYLRDAYGYRVSVGAIAGLTALAIPVALLAPWPQQPSRAIASSGGSTGEGALVGWRNAFQVPLQRWLLIAGFMLALNEGIIIATASVFLAARLGEGNDLIALWGIGTMTGVLLAVRWTANMLFGPLIGTISDRLGQPRTVVLLTILLLGGLGGAVTLVGLGLVLCLGIVFITLSGLFITLTAASSGVAAQAENPHRFVGVYTTAADAGAALGPLLALNLGQVTGFGAMYLTLGVMLMVTVVRYWRLAEQR